MFCWILVAIVILCCAAIIFYLSYEFYGFVSELSVFNVWVGFWKYIFSIFIGTDIMVGDKTVHVPGIFSYWKKSTVLSPTPE